jgi:hypothetical protein
MSSFNVVYTDLSGAPFYKVGVDCPDCDGSGRYEYTKSGVYLDTPYIDIYERRCEYCEQGTIYYEVDAGLYESVDHLEEDYPNSSVTLYKNIKEK